MDPSLIYEYAVTIYVSMYPIRVRGNFLEYDLNPLTPKNFRNNGFFISDFFYCTYVYLIPVISLTLNLSYLLKVPIRYHDMVINMTSV